MNSIEKKIANDILNHANGSIESFTPSLQVQIHHGGKKRVNLSFGVDQKYFDLASLTKVIFTTSCFMAAEKKYKVDLANSNVSDWVSAWPHKNAKIKDYLSHSAKMPAWRPYYRDIRKNKPRDIDAWLLKKLSRIKLSQKNSYTYSDLDYWLCGQVLSEVEGAHLDMILSKNSLFENLNLHFNKGNRPVFKREMYAPTEESRWRKKHLQGEVHDDNCWSFGGVAGHAGLFGTIDDVAQWGHRIRSIFLAQKAVYGIDPVILKKYMLGEKHNPNFNFGFMRATNPLGGHRGVFSSAAIGHTGFTGTSYWFDPKKDLSISILSNRVCPSRRNRKFVGLRKDIHEIIVKAFK